MRNAAIFTLVAVGLALLGSHAWASAESEIQAANAVAKPSSSW